MTRAPGGPAGDIPAREAVAGLDFRLGDAATHPGHVDHAGYEHALAAAQSDLRRLQLAQLAQNARGVVVVEGWDAAGKGGVMRRMAAVLEPRACVFHPIGPPNPAWQRKHWLARFWPMLPDPGAMGVFDRSWYGRVLVERVENLTPEAEWRRGYDEITRFEEMLHNDGIRVVKLFLHVSPEVQLKRFQKRLNDPMKRWKLGAADVRNWELREPYAQAIQEMLQRTSSQHAPWHVLPADDKKYARVRGLQLIFQGLSQGLEMRAPAVDPELARAGARIGLKVPKDAR
jgi:polyphosphate kinase 2 (PPK2 family)